MAVAPGGVGGAVVGGAGLEGVGVAGPAGGVGQQGGRVVGEGRAAVAPVDTAAVDLRLDLQGLPVGQHLAVGEGAGSGAAR